MNNEFCEDRLNTAGAFAQTMIVVDDKATLAKEDESVPERVVQPGRVHGLAAAEDDASAPKDITHLLDAKSLVDSAMDIGLVCSVLNFREDESKEDLSRRISNAATRVDIVCLDWEINNDSGETTRLLIEKIVRHDQEQNGRLRLIAIYTGERDREGILKSVQKKIEEYLTEHEQSRMELKMTEDGREIRSAAGLKIVCLFKKHGTTLTEDLADDQLSEAELPKQLLKEFSTLSEGLLSNVALGTVSRIRDVTHQIIGSFSGDMDGPYFHHRATISNAGEAEDYAVNIVLSGLTSAIKRQNIGRDLAGEKAIKQRVESFAGSRETLRFQYETKIETKCADIKIDDVMKMIINGHKKAEFSHKPGINNLKKYFTSLFSDNLEDSNMLMKKFAVLTSIRSHPGSYSGTQQTPRPELSLGTIVQAPSNQHLLCLQPSCDSVRLGREQMFLFVLLEEKNDEPDHIVPCRTADKTNFIGLSVPDKGYTRVNTLKFNPDSTTKTVLAKWDEINDGMFFECANGVRFKWIAQLKQRPALRTVSEVGRQMSRPGFDEFEPFRKKVKI